MTPFNLAAMDFVWLPILPMVTVAVGAIAVLLAYLSVMWDWPGSWTRRKAGCLVPVSHNEPSANYVQLLLCGI